MASQNRNRDNDTGDNGDGDGSVTDLRSGWITADHNAPTVVESVRQLGQTLANCYSEYRMSLLRAPVSHHRISVQNFDPSLSKFCGHLTGVQRPLLLLMDGVCCSMCGTNDATMGAAS